MNATGHADFSPDGSKYAMVSADNNLMILNFDRCSGNFSLLDSVHVPNPTVGQPDNEVFSCSFSPNSRFLYTIAYTKIIQYDTWAADIATSGIYVAQWDTFSLPFNTYFNMSQLAPDNKIYISTYGGCYLLHYINDPDSAGTSCHVIQNSFLLPRANIGLPNFPNYTFRNQ
nr:Unknown Function [uncultured bacterium]